MELGEEIILSEEFAKNKPYGLEPGQKVKIEKGTFSVFINGFETYETGLSVWVESIQKYISAEIFFGSANEP